MALEEMTLQIDEIEVSRTQAALAILPVTTRNGVATSDAR
jgi:hypothetical protein